MQLPENFNCAEHDPQSVGGQLPVSDANGWPVIITDSEIKQTKAGDGGYIELTLAITEGPNQGASGPYRINLFNANPQSVQIAQRQLSSLGHVTGVMAIGDTSQLHNIPFRAVVAKQKGDDKYTEVKGVKDINGNDPGKGTVAPATPSAGTLPSGMTLPAGVPAPTPGSVPATTQEAPPAAGAPAWGAPDPAPATPAAQPAPAATPVWGGPATAPPAAGAPPAWAAQ